MTETIVMNPIFLSQDAEEKQTKVDATILEIFDESLSTFGESVKEAIYHRFEMDYHLRKQDIPENIENFVATVERVFGVGAGLVEVKLLEALHDRTPGFAYIPNSEKLTFVDYVQGVRSFLKTSVLP